MAHIVLGPFRVDLVELANQGIKTLAQQLAKYNRVYLGFEANGHVYFGYWDHVDLPFVRRLKFLGETRFKEVGLEHVVGRRLDPRSLGRSLDVDVKESTDGKTGLMSFSPTDISEAWLFHFVDED